MRALRVLLVHPDAYDESGALPRKHKGLVPSRTIPYLAALTPSQFDVRVIDESVEEMDLRAEADLVGVTALLHQVPRAIDIGRHFRKRGVKTVIGGVGAYALEDMVRESEAFDCCVIGEADETWPIILEDFAAGRLKDEYKTVSHPDITSVPFARYDLLRGDRYIKWPPGSQVPVLPIETGRGCPNNCRYCLVTRFFGRKMRYRAIGNVVDEMKQQGARQYLFTDDNIAANPERAAELFRAIKPLGVQWVGQFESRVVRHPDLIRLAAESGCRSAFVGVESLDPSNLSAMNKSQNARVTLKELADGLGRHGIILMASLMFGLDNDTPESISRTVEELLDCRIDTMIPWMLIPIPGTPIYDDYRGDARLVHENFSVYDGIHAVIRPRSMSTEQLHDAYWKALRRFYGLRAIAPRVLRAKKGRLVELIYNLRVRRQVRRGLHPFSAV